MISELFSFEHVQEDVRHYVRHMRKAKSMETLIIMTERMECKNISYQEKNNINHAFCIRELELQWGKI